MRGLAAAAAGIGALLANAAACAADAPVSFGNDLLPILTQHCFMCHVQGAEQGSLSLYPEGWSQLVGVPSTEAKMKRVEPGAPERSYLYLKLMGTQAAAGGSGARMPIQQDPLSEKELDLFKRWISEGAAQN
jgi:hypothetical protein